MSAEENVVNHGEMIENEKRRLLDRKNALTVSKVEHQVQLGNIRNLIRTSGMMPREKYAQCCDSQTRHKEGIMHIERELASIKDRMGELYLLERYGKDSPNGADQKPPEAAPEVIKPIVEELVSLRQHYQDFSADGTRVSSMRQMAAEFALKLNPIIKRAIGSER